MIVLYTGRRGSGKTMSMIKDVLKYYESGWKIYSNMDIKIPHEYMTNEDILDIGKSGLGNCVLVIDEIQILLDSRRSMRSGNLDFSYFIQQIRKRHIIILCTAQFGGTVDLRLRQHIDILAKPKYDAKLKVCEVTYMDVTASPFDELEDLPIQINVVFNAQDVFNLYDTDFIIEQPHKKKKKKKKKN